VLFVHRLFRALDNQAHEHGYTPGWNASGQARLYVCLGILSYLTRHFGSSGNASTVSTLLALGLALGGVIPLFAAQKVANLVAGDIEGRSNASITVGNSLLIFLGLLLWANMALGVLVSAGWYRIAAGA
jgi:hypothetical protein